MKKILSTFKINPVQLMKIEADIMSTKVRLMQKNQKYVLKIMQIGQQNSINIRLSDNFTENHQLIQRLNNSEEYQYWHQIAITKQ